MIVSHETLVFTLALIGAVPVMLHANLFLLKKGGETLPRVIAAGFLSLGLELLALVLSVV